MFNLEANLNVSTETQDKITDILNKHISKVVEYKHISMIEEIFQAEVYDKQPLEPKNILLIRLDEIGDMVITSASIKNIRAKYPDATITFVCSPWVKNMLISCPYTDRVITVNKKIFRKMKNVDIIKNCWAVCRKFLLQYNFDTTIVLRHNPDTVLENLLCFLSGAVRRWGFNLDSFLWWIETEPNFVLLGNLMMTRDIIVPPFITHEADKQLYLMQRLGIPTKYKDLALFFTEKDLNTAKEWLSTLSNTSIKILIGIAASIKCKKYPVQRYLQVCQRLLKKYNVSFVVVGSKEEKDDAQFLEDNLSKERILNLCCKTTLKETEAVISLTDCYVGNDTGIMHMASACKIPVVGLFRESPKQDIYPFASAVCLFAPYKTKSVILRPPRPIDDCDDGKYFFGGCKHLNEPHCILQITVDDIVNAFKKLYNEIILKRKNNEQ